MKTDKLTSIFVKNRSFYLIGLALVLGLKCFYSKAGSDDLRWILTPTAWWVRMLGDTPFEYQAGVGYVNHHHRFIIAASCSGLQFMIITMAALIFSFTHRMKTKFNKYAWVIFSVLTSYLFTVFVNSLRIIVSINLAGYSNRLITPEKLHTLIGIVVYFTSLFAIYHLANYVSVMIAADKNPLLPEKSILQMVCYCLAPMFWYFSIALGLPFLNQAYKDNCNNFWSYAGLIIGVCLGISLLFFLLFILQKNLRKRTHREQ